jgi:hypothetical protein
MLSSVASPSDVYPEGGWQTLLDLRRKTVIQLCQMTRSSKMQKARQLNAARGLLQRQIALPEAVRRLSREFDLSERQAYRYLQEASQLGRTIEVPEATVPITLKLPPRTVELLREYARSSGLTIGAIVASALNAFLRALKRHG